MDYLARCLGTSSWIRPELRPSDLGTAIEDVERYVEDGGWRSLIANGEKELGAK